MSEHLRHTPEKHTAKLDLESESQRNLERLQKEAAAHEKTADHLDTLRREIAGHAVSGKEIAHHEHQESSQTPIGVQRELKNNAYKRSLKRAQDSLSTPERTLSRIVHQPIVEKISNVGAQTIARPSGVLGGGAFALVGSSFLLFISKRYGFEYNYLIFFLLFIGGFVIGLLLEGIVKLTQRKRQTD